MIHTKRRWAVLLAASLYLMASTAGTLLYGFFNDRGTVAGWSDFSGWNYFKMFTTDSNLLAGLVAVATAWCAWQCLRGRRKEMPRGVVVWLLTAAGGVALTFVTAALFLGPMMVVMGAPYWSIFGQEAFFLHLLNPLVTAAMLVWLVQPHRLTLRDALIAMIPMVLYSAVYGVCVVGTGWWNDFYGFTFGGHYAVLLAVYPLMYGLTFLLIWGLRCAHNAVAARWPSSDR